MLSKEQFKESADKERAFSRVNSEIKRMENLIRDLLLLAELGESKPIEFHSTDITELVQGLLNDFKTLHPERLIHSTLDENVEIDCVRDHLHRLVQNILTNIEKHTPADAPVRASLKGKAKSLVLVIEDGGPGLPESAYKSEIKAMTRFDPSRSRSSGGSGLGLSIIAAIVQEHEGKLSLSKSDLGGVRVQIELAL
jgi:signal transduction histidine kinase